MTPTSGDPVLLNHFTVAIYPFVHDLTPANRTARVHALDRRWAPWWARLTDHEAAEALDGASFFLPYIRGLLYPEIAGLQGEPTRRTATPTGSTSSAVAAPTAFAPGCAACRTTPCCG